MTIRYRAFLRLCLLCLLAGVSLALDFSPPLSAAVYFVRRTGDDRENGRTPATAWRTMGQAAQMARAGDQVFVGAGTYAETTVRFRSSGHSSQPIQFIADTTGRMTRDAGHVVIAGSRNWTWSFEKCRFIEFDGFLFQPAKEDAYGCLADRSSIVMRNCRFRKLTVGLLASQTDLQLESCVFENNKTFAAVAVRGSVNLVKSKFLKTQGHGFYSYANSRFTADQCDFDDNRGWGLIGAFPKAPWQIRKSSIDSNYSGLWLHRAKEKQFALEVCSIQNNRDYGLYAEESTLVLDPTTKTKYDLIQNNGYGLAGNRSDITVRNFTIEGSRYYGLLSSRGRLHLEKSAVCNNGNGIYLNNNDLVKIQKSRINKNHNWGAVVVGNRWELAHSTIENNRNGIHLSNVRDGQVQVLNTVVANNHSYGLFLDGCEMKIGGEQQRSWKIEKNGYGITSVRSDLTLEQFELRENRLYGLLSYYGKLQLFDSNVRHNGNGVYVYYNDRTHVRNSRLEKNQGWGLLVYGKGCRLHDSVIQANQHGLYLSDITNEQFDSAGTQIRDHRGYGVYANHSELSFRGSQPSRWNLENNAYGIIGYYSKLRFEDFEMRGSKNFGILAYYSDLQLKNCLVEQCGNGLYAYRNERLALLNSRLIDNADWGVLAYGGKCELQDTEIRGNRNGCYLQDLSDKDLKVARATISENNAYGLYLRNCQLQFGDQFENQWLLKNNGYGIAGYQSKLTFDSFEFRGNRIYALLSYSGEVALKDCEFLENRNGIYLNSNLRVELSDTKVHHNDGWGIVLQAGKLTLRNMSVHNNGNGLYLYSTKMADMEHERLQVVDNTGHGIYVQAGELRIDGKGMNMTVRGNGYGVYGYRSTLSLENIDLAGQRNYALVSYYGEVDLRHGLISGGGNGVYLFQNDSAVLQDSVISDCRGWGILSYYPRLAARRLVLRNNGHGLHLYRVNNEQLEVEGLEIRGSRGYGVYARESQLKFDGNDDRWVLADNRYGVSGYESGFQFHNFVLKGCEEYGVVCVGGSLEMLDSSLLGNGHGLYLNQTTDATLERTVVRGSQGWGILQYGGKLSAKNSLIADNQYGVYHRGTRSSDSLTLMNMTLANNRTYGVYQDGGESKLVNCIVATHQQGSIGLAQAGGKSQHRHNLFFNYARNVYGTPLHESELEADPRLIDLVQGDYRLRGHSPAVNRGADLTGIVQGDLAGYARPSYGGWEIGAYEYTRPDEQVHVTKRLERE